MHPSETVDSVLRLAASGLSSTEIARRTGCSRSTVRTWVRGQTPGERRQGACPRCDGNHDPALLATPEYAHLLGLYLGDGCIAQHPRGVHRLRIQFDTRYPGLIEQCRQSLAVVAPRNKVGAQLRSSSGFEGSAENSCLELSVYAKWWPCAFPQHGPGRKHHRRIALVDWQRRVVAEHPEQLLRGLIQSDGCRFINTGRNWSNPRYSFSNRSADIRGIFCDSCDLLGLGWTLAPHTVYVSRKADVARLDGFIGPKA